MESIGVADGAITQVFRCHGNAIASILKDRYIDHFSQFFGQQFAKVGIFAIKHMLIQIWLIIFGTFDICQ